MTPEWYTQLQTIVRPDDDWDFSSQNSEAEIAHVLDLIVQAEDPETQELIRDTFIALNRVDYANPRSQLALQQCLGSHNWDPAQCKEQLDDLLHGWDPGQEDIRGKNKLERTHLQFLSLEQNAQEKELIYTVFNPRSVLCVGLEGICLQSESQATYHQSMGDLNPPRIVKAISSGSHNWQNLYLKEGTQFEMAANGQIISGILEKNYKDPLTGAEYLIDTPLHLYPSGLVASGTLVREFYGHVSGTVIHWNTKGQLVDGESLQSIPRNPLPTLEPASETIQSTNTFPAPQAILFNSDAIPEILQCKNQVYSIGVKSRRNPSAFTADFNYTIYALAPDGKRSHQVFFDSYYTEYRPEDPLVSESRLDLYALPGSDLPADGKYEVQLSMQWISSFMDGETPSSFRSKDALSIRYEVREGNIVSMESPQEIEPWNGRW